MEEKPGLIIPLPVDMPVGRRNFLQRARATVVRFALKNPTVGGFIRDVNLAPPSEKDLLFEARPLTESIIAKRERCARMKAMAKWAFVLLAIPFGLVVLGYGVYYFFLK